MGRAQGPAPRDPRFPLEPTRPADPRLAGSRSSSTEQRLADEAQAVRDHVRCVARSWDSRSDPTKYLSLSFP
eukprot:9468412-Pyramimonas_sp.AAC.1